MFADYGTLLDLDLAEERSMRESDNVPRNDSVRYPRRGFFRHD